MTVDAIAARDAKPSGRRDLDESALDANPGDMKRMA
jgi:hypothetical protein